MTAVTIGNCALLAMTYDQITPSSSLFPELREFEHLLFSVVKPVSRMERLLTASSGPMSGGGTMRLAFTEQSTGWESLTKQLTTDELAVLFAQREGERLALLDWVQSGADQAAYEQDAFPINNLSAVDQITAIYLQGNDRTANRTSPPRLRIRSLVTDRCVTCHGENGRHDTARFIPLDSYDSIVPHLNSESSGSGHRKWLIAALLALYPVAAVAGVLFWHSSLPLPARSGVLAVTSVSLALMSACWLVGSPATTIMLAAAAVAMMCVALQMMASLGELLSNHQP